MSIDPVCSVMVLRFLSRSRVGVRHPILAQVAPAPRTGTPDGQVAAGQKNERDKVAARGNNCEDRLPFLYPNRTNESDGAPDFRRLNPPFLGSRDFWLKVRFRACVRY